MNEPKPEDVMPEGAVVEALEIRAPHDAVCRYALDLLREKDAEIERLRADTVTELVAGVKGILEFDIALTEEETEYIENRIDEFAKEMLEVNE